MTILGVLLAGGLSRRMGGGDKGLMPLGDRPVLGHALARLKAQTDHVIINANGDPNRFAAFGIPVVPDTLDGFAGPLAGVLAGLRHAATMPQNPAFIVTAAADTPYFPKDIASRLLARANTDRTIVLASSGGRRHPTFGLWPVALADDLEAWLADPDNRKVLIWVQRHDWETADFPIESKNGAPFDPFFNINTPEDFATAQALLGKTA
ncbi:MAG: molybdenum cofactor guanylyltransferase MobA [Rhizobiales bacterium]|nr:molybdenum cofactor guanylyltransferase MobA [Hyphomicrobiales bacterium]